MSKFSNVLRLITAVSNFSDSSLGMTKEELEKYFRKVFNDEKTYGEFYHQGCLEMNEELFNYTKMCCDVDGFSEDEEDYIYGHITKVSNPYLSVSDNYNNLYVEIFHDASGYLGQNLSDLDLVLIGTGKQILGDGAALGQLILVHRHAYGVSEGDLGGGKPDALPVGIHAIHLGVDEQGRTAGGEAVFQGDTRPVGDEQIRGVYRFVHREVQLEGQPVAHEVGVLVHDGLHTRAVALDVFGVGAHGQMVLVAVQVFNQGVDAGIQQIIHLP